MRPNFPLAVALRPMEPDLSNKRSESAEASNLRRTLTVNQLDEQVRARNPVADIVQCGLDDRKPLKINRLGNPPATILVTS